MDWTRGRTIGRGSTATVSVAKACRSGQLLAVKSVELSKSELLKREQRILATLNCRQIVAYKGCDVTSEDGNILFNVLMEYAPGGTVVNEILRHGGRLDEVRVRSYAREILYGLEYLHGNGIVHCDIKGHNILVAEDGVKIADFGCARRVYETATAPIVGTPLFMAPEVARGEYQGFAADVWAFGCTVIEMVTGKSPWRDVSDPVSLLYKVGVCGDVPEIPSFMSNQGKDFLRKCLIKCPKERWSARQLLKHSFLEEPKFLSMGNAQDCDLGTPTSVLDQGFWDSLEDQETTQNSTGENFSISSLDRIRRLAEECTISLMGLPNWEFDENWVTVRINSNIKEPEPYLSVANQPEPAIERHLVLVNETESCTTTTTGSFSNSSKISSRYKQISILMMTSVCTKTDAMQSFIIRCLYFFITFT